MKYAVLCAVLMSMTIHSAHAETCNDYPVADGISLDNTAEGTKILSTGSVDVSFDDTASVKDAQTEATLIAKAGISKFFSEDIQSNDVVNRLVNESKSMQGSSKTATRSETVERVRKLSSHSQALLKGVVTLGSCYTPAKEFRVTVGLKPETINAAIGMNDRVKADHANNSDASGSAVVQGLQHEDGFSRTENLKKF